VSREIPRALGVETIYSAADRFLLDGLKAKALDFMKRTCTVNNITARTFGEFADLHTQVDVLYSSYFKRHVGEIMETPEYLEYFENVESSTSEERARVNSKFRGLMQNELKGLKRKRELSGWH
jgi:hypothetical protein